MLFYKQTFNKESKKFKGVKYISTLFIEKYPDHDLVASAKYELETLGKDISEQPIIKKIEEKEQTKTED